MIKTQYKTTLIFIGILIFLIFGAVVFPLISPFDYAAQNVAYANMPPLFTNPQTGGIHYFGTDSLGRDIFVRLWYGARISFFIAIVVVIIDCIIGVLYGGISGYMGGRVDMFMMRILEIVSGIPYLIIVLLMLVVLPKGLGTIILAYALTGWTQMARLIRAQVISLCQKEFILIAKVMGGNPMHIIIRHIVPNLLHIIVVNITLDIPGVIFTEAFLSMLGLGLAPPMPSLGIMINEGIRIFQIYPTQLICSGIFICLIMLSFNVLGDKMQAAFAPGQRRFPFV